MRFDAHRAVFTGAAIVLAAGVPGAGAGDVVAASPPAAASLARPGGYNGGAVMVTVESDGRTVHWERSCMIAPSDAGILQAMTFVLHPSGDGLDADGDAASAGAGDPCGPPRLAARWHVAHVPQGDFLVGEADLPDLVNLANAAGAPNDDARSFVLRRISGENVGQWPDARALIPPSWRPLVRDTPLVAHVTAMGPRESVVHGWQGMPPAPPTFRETVSWRATLHLDRGRAEGVFPGMVLYATASPFVAIAHPQEPRRQIDSGLAPIALVERVGAHDSDAIIGWNISPPITVGGELRSSGRQ